ncbi:hypothetical protein Y032_0666g1334 [Ancylostoma ceylanicum]|uniref:Uncharacterized protein n=1 Tax=Ancylostoma ceylanicum TaxID=53326 RepID=A0A016WI09_9BILA|nr:hypothetical protein Y032_0666g1334 [Ancylostoma ceylanicum]
MQSKRKERSNASVPGGEIKDQTLYNNSSPLYTCMYKTDRPANAGLEELLFFASLALPGSTHNTSTILYLSKLPCFGTLCFVDSGMCDSKAYSRGNWIIVTVRFRDRSNNMIELDSRLTTNFMTSTCREAKIAVSTNFEDIMMARFTSTL